MNILIIITNNTNSTNNFSNTLTSNNFFWTVLIAISGNVIEAKTNSLN